MSNAARDAIDVDSYTDIGISQAPNISPIIDLDDATTCVLVEQSSTVDLSWLGDRVRYLKFDVI